MFNRVDAAIEWGDGKVYLFREDQYVRYNPGTQVIEAGPKPIAGNWRGIPERDLDTAVNWGNGKIYFFKGDQYFRYDLVADCVDEDYPKRIADSWPQLWDRDLDAAVNWWNEKVYFFKGKEYVRWDIADDRVEDGWPKPIGPHWRGVWDQDIDAAVNWGDGKVYFFKGSDYTRYDLATDSTDLGPVPIPVDFADLNASNGSPRAIAWGRNVSAEFRNRILEISADLGTEPSHLMAAIAFETGKTFSPSIRNKASGATGLIQFMPSTATSLGTSTDELAGMSAEAQLDLVARYFQPNRGKLRTLADVYMAILWPAAVGKPADYVLFAKPGVAYQQNAGLDRNQDGKVTKTDAERQVRRLLAEGLKVAQ